MARSSVIEREKKRAKLNNRYGARRDALRERMKDINLTAQERFEAQLALQKLPRNSSKIRAAGRCQLTGRPRGVYNKRFGMSRGMLRKLAMMGYVPGLKKASW